MDGTLKEGDVVRVNRGDEILLVTIELLSENLDLAICYWFHHGGRKYAPFAVRDLNKVSDSERPPEEEEDFLEARCLPVAGQDRSRRSGA